MSLINNSKNKLNTKINEDKWTNIIFAHQPALFFFSKPNKLYYLSNITNHTRDLDVVRVKRSPLPTCLLQVN